MYRRWTLPSGSVRTHGVLLQRFVVHIQAFVLVLWVFISFVQHQILEVRSFWTAIWSILSWSKFWRRFILFTFLACNFTWWKFYLFVVVKLNFFEDQKNERRLFFFGYRVSVESSLSIHMRKRFLFLVEKYVLWIRVTDVYAPQASYCMLIFLSRQSFLVFFGFLESSCKSFACWLVNKSSFHDKQL